MGRLPVYLRALLEAAESRSSTISSEGLAELSGVNAAKVRKDLSYIGTYGTRGVGYDVEQLIFQISRELGLTDELSVAIIGFGNLGRALANYKGFAERGFNVAAVFDSDKSKIGEPVGDVRVRPISDLPKVASSGAISIAIIATPAPAAQQVADLLVASGVKAILNFAPAVLSVPEDVSLRKVDLSIELQILSFYQQRGRAEDSRVTGS